METDPSRQQIAAMRQSFFDEGILDEHFSQLEDLVDEDCPNFAEEVITLFYRDTTKLLDKIEKLLEQYPDEFPWIDKCLHQLKGTSASIGAIKIQAEASKIREFCKQGNLEEAMASFKQLRVEHDTLKAKLEPYFQLMRQARSVETAVRPKKDH
ncbi:hypothetical protein SLA2020_221350 [Shorea laevis]